MPKLDATHTADRLRRCIDALEAGKEVAAKELKAALTQAQWEAMEDAWAEQRKLRSQTRARTEEQQQALGWRTKRQLRLEMLKEALEVASAASIHAWRAKQDKAAVRQTRIYFEAYAKARADGKDVQASRSAANNELTRAGLRRMDGKVVGHQSKRDKEVFDLEEGLRQRPQRSGGKSKSDT